MTAVNLTLGKDTDCADYLRPGRVVSGQLAFGQACYRRLRTERGSLESDPNYGLPLAMLLGAELTESELAAIPSRIGNELAKDDRYLDSSVVLTRERLGSAWETTVDITVESTVGPFRLSLLVADVTVSLLQLETTT
jgi:hypothetical protein